MRIEINTWHSVRGHCRVIKYLNDMEYSNVNMQNIDQTLN